MSSRAGAGGKREVGLRPLRDKGRDTEDTVSRGHRLIRSLLGKRGFRAGSHCPLSSSSSPQPFPHPISRVLQSLLCRVFTPEKARRWEFKCHKI